MKGAVVRGTDGGRASLARLVSLWNSTVVEEFAREKARASWSMIELRKETVGEVIYERECKVLRFYPHLVSTVATRRNVVCTQVRKTAYIRKNSGYGHFTRADLDPRVRRRFAAIRVAIAIYALHALRAHCAMKLPPSTQGGLRERGGSSDSTVKSRTDASSWTAAAHHRILSRPRPFPLLKVTLHISNSSQSPVSVASRCCTSPSGIHLLESHRPRSIGGAARTTASRHPLNYLHAPLQP